MRSSRIPPSICANVGLILSQHDSKNQYVEHNTQFIPLLPFWDFLSIAIRFGINVAPIWHHTGGGHVYQPPAFLTLESLRGDVRNEKSGEYLSSGTKMSQICHMA